jgi:hypothetical protein
MPDSYRDLRVWQYAMKVTVCVYNETEHFPRRELYGLSAQLSGRRFQSRVTLRKERAVAQIRTS